jgi:hypothetical protein
MEMESTLMQIAVLDIFDITGGYSMYGLLLLLEDFYVLNVE